MNTDNRTDDELNRIIAEWCGWSFAAEHDVGFPTPAGIVFPEMWYNPDGGNQSSSPNYCRDLNAVHEAVMSIPVSERVHLNYVMCEMLRENDAYFLDRAINSTARQRAEALVRVIETTTTTNHNKR